MKLVSLLEKIDYEQQMKICVEENETVCAAVNGNQASIIKMLSEKMLDADISCIAARDGNVLYVWLEESD